MHAGCTVPNYLCGMERDRLEYLIKAGLLKGVLGTFGNWVFRRQKGGHIVHYLKYSGPVSNTPKQQKSRSKFREAVQYANQAMLVPDIKAKYATIAKKKKKYNVHLLATQYYLKGIHIPLPMAEPRKEGKYESWEAILQEIHQMQSLLASKKRRRQKNLLGRKPTPSPTPQKPPIGNRQQGKWTSNLGYHNTT